MRSGTIVQSGETTGCVGCHDNRRGAPAQLSRKIPMALQRAPSKLNGWYGKPRIFSYIKEVQPVLDKHCVSCHDYNKDDGKELNLAGDRTNTFNTSYNELWRKKYINAIGAGPYETQPAYSWGSHASKIIEVILAGHYDIKLSKNEFETIATWIDLNGVYYPRYDTAYPDNLTGRSPLNNEQIERLSVLTGIPFVKLAAHNNNSGPQISFDRPGLSPCLAKIKDTSSPEYIEALAIICAGSRMLEERPRADMPGFEACTIDQQRQQEYVARQQIELRNRQAINKGQKLYDDIPVE